MNEFRSIIEEKTRVFYIMDKSKLVDLSATNKYKADGWEKLFNSGILDRYVIPVNKYSFWRFELLKNCIAGDFSSFIQLGEFSAGLVEFNFKNGISCLSFLLEYYNQNVEKYIDVFLRDGIRNIDKNLIEIKKHIINKIDDGRCFDFIDYLSRKCLILFNMAEYNNIYARIRFYYRNDSILWKNLCLLNSCSNISAFGMYNNHIMDKTADFPANRVYEIYIGVKLNVLCKYWIIYSDDTILNYHTKESLNYIEKIKYYIFNSRIFDRIGEIGIVNKIWQFLCPNNVGLVWKMVDGREEGYCVRIDEEEMDNGADGRVDDEADDGADDAAGGRNDGYGLLADNIE